MARPRPPPLSPRSSSPERLLSLSPPHAHSCTLSRPPLIFAAIRPAALPSVAAHSEVVAAARLAHVAGELEAPAVVVGVRAGVGAVPVDAGRVVVGREVEGDRGREASAGCLRWIEKGVSKGAAGYVYAVRMECAVGVRRTISSHASQSKFSSMSSSLRASALMWLESRSLAGDAAGLSASSSL